MGQKKYVDSTEQLVTEIVVRDIQRSTKFYRELGFKVLRDAGDFVELTWEDHQLYIAELSAYHEITSDDQEMSEPWSQMWTIIGNWQKKWERKLSFQLPIGIMVFGIS
jgi:extradiol dioxygenase family protein